MNHKTREYLHYLSTLSMTAAFGAVFLTADTARSDDAPGPESCPVQKDSIPPWYYQAWPESTFHRFNPPGSRELADVDFAGLFAEIKKA